MKTRVSKLRKLGRGTGAEHDTLSDSSVSYLFLSSPFYDIISLKITKIGNMAFLKIKHTAFF